MYLIFTITISFVPWNVDALIRAYFRVDDERRHQAGRALAHNQLWTDRFECLQRELPPLPERHRLHKDVNDVPESRVAATLTSAYLADPVRVARGPSKREDHLYNRAAVVAVIALWITDQREASTFRQALIAALQRDPREHQVLAPARTLDLKDQYPVEWADFAEACASFGRDDADDGRFTTTYQIAQTKYFADVKPRANLIPAGKAETWFSKLPASRPACERANALIDAYAIDEAAVDGGDGRPRMLLAFPYLSDIGFGPELDPAPAPDENDQLRQSASWVAELTDALRDGEFVEQADLALDLEQRLLLEYAGRYTPPLASAPDDASPTATARTARVLRNLLGPEVTRSALGLAASLVSTNRTATQVIESLLSDLHADSGTPDFAASASVAPGSGVPDSISPLDGVVLALEAFTTALKMQPPPAFPADDEAAD